MTPPVNILAFALYPVVALMAGGATGLVRTPGAALRSVVQHFTAGVIFAALATELLPDLMHRRMPMGTAIGSALGVLTMLIVKGAAEKLGQRSISQAKQPTSLVITLLIDTALDGVSDWVLPPEKSRDCC